MISRRRRVQHVLEKGHPRIINIDVDANVSMHDVSIAQLSLTCRFTESATAWVKFEVGQK